MKSLKLKIGSIILMILIVFSFSVTNSYASKTVGKKRMTEKDLTAMKETKKLNRKIKKSHHLKKAPKWQKWKESNDQKFFH